MRITSLGYNLASKTCQNPQNNNAPAFKSKIRIEGLENDAELLENTLSQLGHLVKYYACLLCKGLEDSEVIIKDNTLEVPKRADGAAEKASDSLNEAYAKFKVGIKLLFEPSAE